MSCTIEYCPSIDVILIVAGMSTLCLYALAHTAITRYFTK